MSDAGSKNTSAGTVVSTTNAGIVNQQSTTVPSDNLTAPTSSSVQAAPDLQPDASVITAAYFREEPTPLPWFRRRPIWWIVIVITLVLGAILVTHQAISLHVLTAPTAELTATLDRWNKISELAKDLITIIAIILGGFWTYFTFIKGRTLKAQLEPKVIPRLVKRGNEKFLVATIQLKNTGKTIINFQQSGTRLLVFQYQPNATSTTITEQDWHLYYAAPPILRDHLGIEPSEQIEEPVLVPLEPNDQQIYMIRLRVNSKKTTWTVDTIAEGDPPRDKLSEAATSQSGEEKAHVS